MDVSENGGTPKASILIGFSIINHPFWGTPIFGDTHICHSKTKPSNARNRSPSSGSGGAAPRIMLCTRITMLDPAKELRQRVRPVRFEVRLAVNLLKCHPNMSIQSHQLRTSNNSFSRTHTYVHADSSE